MAAETFRDPTKPDVHVGHVVTYTDEGTSATAWAVVEAITDGDAQLTCLHAENEAGAIPGMVGVTDWRRLHALTVVTREGSKPRGR